MRISRRHFLKGIGFTAAAMTFSGCSFESSRYGGGKKPNIVYILADDLGYGDLSCYGQKKFQTPNIDRLATEGMKFTQHYSGSTVCAPSRCTLMTGLHTGHSQVRDNRENKPEGQAPMSAGTVTIPTVLRQAGYVSGMFGKWGLGGPGSASDPAKLTAIVRWGSTSMSRAGPDSCTHSRTRTTTSGCRTTGLTMTRLASGCTATPAARRCS